jgi:opine dehydrogenase
MNKIVAILGGGNGAHAAAVDLSKRGFTVRLYEDARFADKMASVFETKKISYSGALGEGSVTLSMVSSNLPEVLKGADTVIISVPAFAHKVYAEKLPDLLEDGQLVLIFAGAFGSLIFWNELKKKGIKKDIIFAETYTLPYATRLDGPGKSVILTLTNPVCTGVMPAKRTAGAMERLKPLYPVVPAKSVLESGLYTLNPVIHVPGCILNAGRIELMQGEFWFYKEGVTPGVGRVTEMLDQERLAITEKLGYKADTLMEFLAAAGAVGADVHEAISTNEQFAKLKGPDNFKNRYFSEDIPFGLVGWAVLAKAIGVPTPIMDSLITLGNGLLQQDCWKTGRQLKDLGLEGMGVAEILDFVQNG